MRRALRAIAVLLAAVLFAAGGVAAVAWSRIQAFRRSPFGVGERTIEIPAGASAHQVVRLLTRGGALADEATAWRYVRFVKRDPRPLRAGEYAFDGPMLPDAVLEKVYRGDVKTYQVTIPEGLRIDETAQLVEEAGLGRADELVRLARDPLFAHSLSVNAPDLEGTLFPDTYTFTRNPSARAVLSAMVGRYHEAWSAANASRAPGVTLGEREALTLASIIEKETGRPDERPRISCVFHNRLRRGIPLATDPTVMYATFVRTGRWSKNITKRDLATPHPYNTYLVRGLPPGPIASPGAASLEAALHPAACDDLFFVSRNDGSHVFCPDLRCHEAAVKKWQIDWFRAQRGRR